ncbi:hypothetical protein IQ276_016855 [Desmonostoc muscorum LEGE 12446]|uniref:hypothetical protein n=1 Tax=Desmonostoc muscorum TaxID=1179 RepID=UPI001F3F2A40|nr:hypothetical protein [Desmonostoc muscorum]MCF2148063.1 hypothetical protein [Desmonostoc muscorum LEGE 12446]
MVRIKIYDLHPSTNKQFLNEITVGEMKKVEGGVGYTGFDREFPNTFDTNNSSSPANPEISSPGNSLQQVNSLLDSFRLGLDKVFQRLV